MISRRLGWIPLLLAVPLATATAGTANRCKATTLAPSPVKMEHLTPVVSARIDGVEAQFIVDTGSFFDFLSPAAPAQFKLPLGYAKPWYSVEGVGGSIVPRVATAKTFAVAGMTLRNVLFLVSTDDFRGGQVGVLGQDIFRVADVDYDFADGMLRFANPQHCEGAGLAHWASTRPVREVDLQPTSKQRTDLIGKASVNGHDIRVLFDTGSPRTILSLPAANRAGITLESPGVVPAGVTGGVGMNTIRVWSAPVASFEIGGETIRHTHVLIGDIELADVGADMLLGADFFLAHHIYVAYGQDKLYFTYNGGPVFDLNAPQPVRTTGHTPR